MVSKSAQAERRRLKVEAQRREAHAKAVRRRIIAIVVAVVVLAVIAGAVVLLVRGLGGGGSNGSGGSSGSGAASRQIIPAEPTGSTTRQPEPERVANDSGIDGVLAWNTAGYPGTGTATDGTLGHDHVQGPVDYAVTPPVGGPHAPIWMNAGVYTKPVPSERAVHDMEHGAVWITYRPSLPASQVRELTAFVAKQSMIDESGGNANRYITMSPWASNDLPSPIVLTAWGHQLRLDSPTDARLQSFVDTFRHNQTYTPEFGAAVDGVPVQTGGRPASNASRLANPAGSAG